MGQSTCLHRPLIIRKTKNMGFLLCSHHTVKTEKIRIIKLRKDQKMSISQSFYLKAFVFKLTAKKPEETEVRKGNKRKTKQNYALGKENIYQKLKCNLFILSTLLYIQLYFISRGSSSNNSLENIYVYRKFT